MRNGAVVIILADRSEPVFTQENPLVMKGRAVWIMDARTRSRFLVLGKHSDDEDFCPSTSMGVVRVVSCGSVEQGCKPVFILMA